MALREILAEFGIEIDDSKLDPLQQKIQQTIESLKGFGAAVAAGAIVKGVVGFATETAAMADRIEDSAVALGISTEAFQSLSLAAKQSGDDIADILPSLGRLSLEARNAADKVDGTAGKAFAKLGVKVKDASGQMKTSDVLLAEVAKGFDGVVNPTERAALAADLFGRGGATKVLPFLVSAGPELANVAKEAQALGGGFNQAAFAAGGKFQKATASLGFALDGLRARLSVALLPALTRLAEGAAKVVAQFIALAEHSSILQALLVALGAVLIGLAVAAALALAPLLIAMLPIILGVAGLILLVDELITLFRGGDTVIGRVLDQLFGVGTAKRFVEDMTAAWELFKGAVEAVGGAIGIVRSIIQGVVGFVDRLVGRITQLTEALDNLTGGRTKKVDLSDAAFADAVKTKLAAKGQSINTLQSIASLAAPVGGQSLAAPVGGQSLINAPQSVSAPAAAASRNVSISSPVNITIEGGASPETADAIGRRVREEMAAMTREAGEILVSEAP